MPTITNGQQLLAALGPVVNAADPIVELKARGFTLAPALARSLDTPAARALFASAGRQRLLAERRGRRAPTVQAGPLTRIAPLLPGGHHDLTVGIKLEKADEILADAYAKRSIPRGVDVPGRAPAAAFDTLLAVLRGQLIGVPAGNDIHIGTLHIAAAPTVSALPTPPPRPGQPVDPTARLLVHLPIVLDIDRAPANGPRERAITTLEAVAHFGIALSARVNEELDIAAGAVPGQIGASDPERMRLTIAASSPLKPVDADSGDRIGLAIELGGFQGLLRDVAFSTTIAPRIRLPLGAGLNVFVRHVDLRTIPSTGGAGHLMVGLEIGAEPSPVPLTGQPELLERDPFDGPGSTVFIEAHAELFRVLVKQAFASGELEKIAKEKQENTRLEGADAELGPNSIGLFVEGTLVDECGVFGSNFKDVGFDGWIRVELRGIDAGQIHYEEVESLGIGDAHVGDVAVCVLLSFLDLKILKIGKALLEAFFSKLSGWIFGSSSATDTFVNLLDPNFPIPGTELLPRLRALAASIDPSALSMQAALDLVPDTINTYVYVRCESRLLPHLGATGVTVPGAHVRLLDQDVPPPAGDDAPVPEVGTTETKVGPRRLRTVDVSFTPSPADEELASGTTDGQGRVQLVVSPGRVATSAGVVTTITITEDISTGEIVSSNVRRRVISEPRPDVYFVIDVPGGGRLDTRSVSGGFVRNLDSKRWGTATQPLVFNVPRPIGPIIRERPR